MEIKAQFLAPVQTWKYVRFTSIVEVQKALLPFQDQYMQASKLSRLLVLQEAEKAVGQFVSPPWSAKHIKSWFKSQAKQYKDARLRLLAPPEQTPQWKMVRFSSIVEVKRGLLPFGKAYWSYPESSTARATLLANAEQAVGKHAQPPWTQSDILAFFTAIKKPTM